MAAGDVLDDDVSLIVERRDEALRWYNREYWDEFEEVYRAAKCRTKPIMIKGRDGKTKEDVTRTNVCMPDIAAMIRRNTARLTANPPSQSFISEDNPQAADKLSTWASYQYDRSGEDQVNRLVVQQAETFGISFSKVFWNKITSARRLRVDRTTADRETILKALKTAPENIKQQVEQKGAQLSSAEMSRSIAEYGPEVLKQIDVTKYEGPGLKFIFVGDLFIEPGFQSIDTAAWKVESYWEAMPWLEDMSSKSYCDLETGEELPVFDEKACAELESMDSPTEDETTPQSLRTRLRSAIGQSRPEDFGSKRLIRGKKFKVLECHEMIDGWMWVSWVANEKILLGKMPYPWDLDGRSVYSELVLLPDLVQGIGDSTPRLGRFLHFLHNTIVNQRTDVINNVLRRPVFRRKSADLPDDPVERSQFRIYDVKDFSDWNFPQEPDVPAGAFQTEAQIKAELAELDPSAQNISSPGNSFMPQAGKTATNSVLQQRSNDVLLNYKLNGYAIYQRATMEKKILMLQQALQEPLDIPGKYNRTEALRTSPSGEVSKITIKPLDIQCDLSVEPEIGSTLSVDDEFHRQAAERMLQMALSAPTVFNVTEAARLYLKTVRGADTSAILLPPSPPPPPPPKSSFALTGKFEDMPADVQNQILVRAGFQPSEELVAKDTLKGVIEAGKAGDAAANLALPPQVNGGNGAQPRAKAGAGAGA